MTSEFLEVLWVHGDMVPLFLWCLDDAALLIPEKPHYTILKGVTQCVLHACADMSTCLLSYLCLAAPFSGLCIFTLLEVPICLVFLPVIKLSLTSKVMWLCQFCWALFYIFGEIQGKKQISSTFHCVPIWVGKKNFALMRVRIFLNYVNQPPTT